MPGFPATSSLSMSHGAETALNGVAYPSTFLVESCFDSIAISVSKTKIESYLRKVTGRVSGLSVPMAMPVPMARKRQGSPRWWCLPYDVSPA